MSDQPVDETVGHLETVHTFDDGPMPTGVAVSASGRVFVNYPKWGDEVPATVDPRLLWPDTMALAADGYLYDTANQLHRQPNHQGGADRRRKPYARFRVAVDAGPVRLPPA
jgi:hypothetical protein